MDDVSSNILLCQKKIEKYIASKDDDKLIYYLSKLKHLAIKVSHLEQTGVGRSVNALRHKDGQVGERARSLVAVWKKMVTAEEDGMCDAASDDRRRSSSGSAVVVEAILSPRPSKQQPPTQQQSPEEEEDEDDGCLQIKESDQSDESPGHTEQHSKDLIQQENSSRVLGASNGGKHAAAGSSKYGQPNSDEEEGGEDKHKYDPYTSKQDYQSIGVNSVQSVEYQPTTIDSPTDDGGGLIDVQEEAEEEDVEDKLEELDQSHNSSHGNHKNKSKHKDKSRDKKHKSHSKDRESKDKHRHKSSERDKDRSHKDKKKEKERSPIKKHKDHSEKRKETDLDDTLDRRRSKSNKHSSSNSNVDDMLDDAISLDGSPIDNDIIMINGHDLLVPDDVNTKDKKDSSSSKHKSHNKHSISSSSSSSREGKKEDKHKKKDKKKDDRKKERDTLEETPENDHHKSKKRKLDSEEGFGAALMGLSSPSSKKKKSKSHKSKDEKSHRSKDVGKVHESLNGNGSGSKHVTEDNSKASTSKSSHEPLKLMALSPSCSPEQQQQQHSSGLSLPKIDPNYKPLPRIPLPDNILDDVDVVSHTPVYAPYVPQHIEPQLTQEQCLERMMSSKGKAKRQIYSGKTTAFVQSTEVPSLFSLSVKCLQENIDALEYTGGVPYDLLKPVIERTTVAQLFNLENYNPYLLEDTNELWEQHCKRDFKGVQPDEMETYRDMYMRLKDEREQKLKSLTENLQSKFVTKPAPRRTTQLAFVNTVAKPPKSVARAQAKYGTGVPVGAPAKTTKAAEIIARKHAMQNVQRTERTINNNNSRSAAAARKPKAPLMAKTMQFYKKTFRR